MKKLNFNTKKVNELFDIANKVFPIRQEELPSLPHHAIIMDETYGLTLNLFLADRKAFAQTCIDEKNFDWNNIEVELTNLWKMIYTKEKAQ